MTVFTQQQIEQLWIQYGGNPSYARMASAIAMAESGGRSTATNQNSNGSIDRGIFQINSTHGAQSTYDVANNVRAAIRISSNGTNWRPWCTAWSDGLCGAHGGTFLGPGAPYQKFMNGASVPAGATGGAPPTDTATLASNPLNPATWINGVNTLIVKPTLQYAWWILETMLGAGMALTGVILLAGVAVRNPNKAPTSDTTAGKAANVVAAVATEGESVAAKKATARVYKARAGKPQPRREPVPTSRYKVIDGEVVQRKEITS